MSPQNNSWVIQASADQFHPNKRFFRGVLTTLDTPSDAAPSGSRGHKVILTHAAAASAVPGLIGMAVGFSAGWSGHDARQKCGIILDAEIVAKELIVSGYIYSRDFPDVIKKLETKQDEMGMSFELADAHVADMRKDIWILTRAVFTGAAILLREKAAYKSTSFELVDQKRQAA